MNVNPLRATQADIAQKLGVSKTSVGLALRNHPRISPELRARVKRVAEELDYRPDPFLSRLSAYRQGRRTQKMFQGVIAWINRWDQPARLRGYREFDRYWRGATDAARQFGYQLEEIHWARECSGGRFEQILLARGILGVLIPPHHELLEWRDLDWSKFSLIRLGTSVHEPDSNVVTTDQHQAVMLAVAKIREHGYQRIGFVVGRAFDAKLGCNYSGGFFSARQSLQLEPALPPFFTDEERYRADPVPELEKFRRWLEARRPDAILTTEPHLSEMLKRLGRRVPRDIAVAGTSVHDLPVDAGIDQNSYEIGRIAVEMLIKQINVNERGRPSSPFRILVKSSWRDGKSLPPRKPRR